MAKKKEDKNIEPMNPVDGGVDTDGSAIPTIKGSVISMKGVSGKNITGSVVVVKKSKPKKAEEESVDKAVDKAAEETVEKTADKADLARQEADLTMDASQAKASEEAKVAAPDTGAGADQGAGTTDQKETTKAGVKAKVDSEVKTPKSKAKAKTEETSQDAKSKQADVKVSTKEKASEIESETKDDQISKLQDKDEDKKSKPKSKATAKEKSEDTDKIKDKSIEKTVDKDGLGENAESGSTDEVKDMEEKKEEESFVQAPSYNYNVLVRPESKASPTTRRTSAAKADQTTGADASLLDMDLDVLDATARGQVQKDGHGKGRAVQDRRDGKPVQPRVGQEARDKHNKLRKQTNILPTGRVSQALQDDFVLDSLISDTGGRNRYKRQGRPRGKKSTQVITELTHVTLPDSLTVKELAETIKKTSAEVIKRLMGLGVMATLNQEIDFDTASIILDEFNITSERAVVVTEEDILFDDTDDKEEDLVSRPPVVVVMGHVDHGKTSLLDAIRSESVVKGEAGGITQHIGAYTVKVQGKNITFLDTPGHEAFTTMRARGAQVTDIAILVVAADDGIMPQTIEAINHAKAAKVEIIVAINKIDKPAANPERVKQELTEYGLVTQEWGGDNIMVPVSALTGENIDELLENVLLLAEIMDLKSNPDKQAKGTVIEAKLDKNRGPVATVLVQRGTLRTGDTLITGAITGRVRTMHDDKGQIIKEAGPSIPVEITGLPEVPDAGEVFYAVEDEKVARALTERRRVEEREQQLKASSKMSLDTLFTQMSEGVVKELNIIVKADVQGSVEAVTQSFQKLTIEDVRINVIHGAVGTITESDLRLADVSNAIVIGFNVRPTANVSKIAEELGVDVRLYRVIYEAIEELEASMKGMLDKKFKEVVLGHVEIRQIFKVSGVGTIGGAYVTDGKILRNSDVRLLREGVIIHEGKLASLKRFKDDVREVASGYECGISIERYNDIKEGDVIEAFTMQEVERD